jgi:soluble lytic murein transglycosylase-like protein
MGQSGMSLPTSRGAAVLSLSLAVALAGCVSAPGPKSAAAPAPSQTAAGEGSEYDGLIARYAEENGVPLPLAHAVVEKESGYNPRARGGGAVGLMQIKPATARGIGYGGSTAGLYDPETNLQWGMKYLGSAYQLGHGDVCGTALRYQGGHRATSMTAASRRYCSELKAIMAKNGT